MSCFQKVRQKLCILLVTFFVLFFFLPVLMLLFLPMYGWRFLIYKLSKIFRSTEGKMLCTYASLFASDKIFKRPLCNLIVVLLVQGRLDINKLRQDVQTRLLDKRVQTSSSRSSNSSNNQQQEEEEQEPSASTTLQGDLAYPELRQYISTWPFCLGYYFWTFDKQFSLDHYVKEYDGKYKDITITDQNMGQLVNELNIEPFKKTKSPWEMILLNDVCIKSSHTVEGRVRARNKDFVQLILSEKSEKEGQNKKDYPANLNPFTYKKHALKGQSKVGTEAETMKEAETEEEEELVYKILNPNPNPNPTSDNSLQQQSEQREKVGDGEIIKGILQENSGQSMVILRMSHCMGDGISMRNLILDFINYSQLKFQSKSYERNPKTKSICSKIVHFFNTIFFPILGVYQTISCMFECYDVNPWHIPEGELTREMSCAASSPIPIRFIKDIKNHHDTTFNAAIICGISGAIRTFMLRNDLQVPENIHVLSPLPFKVSDKLRNHVTAAFLRLPVGLTNPEDRMIAIKKYLKELNKSLVPVVNYFAFPLLGGLFPGLTRKLYRQSVPTGLISAFPGPDEPLMLNGKPIVDMVFGGGLHKGNISFGFTLLSYNGWLRILCGFDKALFPHQDKSEELVQDVIQEFHNLKACSSNLDKDASV